MILQEMQIVEASMIDRTGDRTNNIDGIGRKDKTDRMKMEDRIGRNDYRLTEGYMTYTYRIGRKDRQIGSANMKNRLFCEQIDRQQIQRR